MQIVEVLGKIFELCIIPLIGILMPFVIQFLRTKTAAAAEAVDSKLAKKYITMLGDTVTNAVISVNQTYVEALKDKNAFTIEAQKEAFNMAYNIVIHNLAEEAQEYLSEIYEDLSEYIKVLIEAKVNENK